MNDEEFNLANFISFDLLLPIGGMWKESEENPVLPFEENVTVEFTVFPVSFTEEDLQEAERWLLMQRLLDTPHPEWN